jgi:hypothetical protein
MIACLKSVVTLFGVPFTRPLPEPGLFRGLSAPFLNAVFGGGRFAGRTTKALVRLLKVFASLWQV